MANTIEDRREVLLQELERRKAVLTPRQQELIDRARMMLPNPAGERLETQAPQAPMASAPPRQPSSFMRSAEIAAGGFNEGLSETIGLPVDIINAGLSSIGLPTSDTPFMGSRFIEKYLMPEGAEPDKPGERVTKRVGKEVGATVPFAALTVGAQSLKVAEHGRTVISGILKDLQAMDPAKLSAIEEGLAASGGLGAGLVKELFPNGGPWAEFVGEVLGSLAPSSALGLIRKVKEAGSFVASKIGFKTEEEMKRQLGEQLNKLGRTEKLEKGIEEAEELQQDIPGFDPTTGQVSGEPGIVQAERGYERTSSGAVQKFETRKRDSQTAVGDFVEEGRPKSSTPLGDLQAGIQASKERRAALLEKGVARAQAEADVQKQIVSEATAKVIRKTEEQMTKADARAANRLDAIGSKLTPQQAGTILREEYQQELDTAQAALDAKWDKIDRTIPLPATNTQDAVKFVRNELQAVEAPEFVPSHALDNLGRLGVQREQRPIGPMSKVKKTIETAVPVPFGELIAARRDLQGQIRAAKNDTLKHRLGILLDGVDRDLDQLADNPEIRTAFPDQAAAYQDAKIESYKVIQRLKAGQADKMRALDRRGRFRTIDEEAADLFLNGKASIDDFTAAIGSRPRARMALEESAKLDFYEHVVDKSTGQIRPKASADWLFKHDAMLKEFPELRTQFTDAAQAQTMADDIKKRAKEILKDPARVARIEDPAAFAKMDRLDREAARVLQVATKTQAAWEKGYAADFMGKDSTRVAEAIVSSKRPATEIDKVLSMIKGDELALRGFQREIWDASLAKFESRAIDAAGRPVLQARAMREFLEENKDWMHPLFGAERMARLGKASKAMEMLERTGKPIMAGSDTAINLQATLSDLGPFMSRLYAEQRGIVSLKWIIGERAARGIGKHLQRVTNEQAEALLREAFFDPKVAQTLMLAAQDASPQLIRQRFRTHLLNMNQYDLAQEDDQ